MDLYLIRHTTPDIDQGVAYGQLDLDLVKSFDQEAEAILKCLPARFEAIYTSPLKRCLKLAEKIGKPILPDRRIMELRFGKWEGMKWNEINPAKLDCWMKDYLHQAPPDGESMLELKDRVCHFYNEIQQKHRGPVAVVTHAGVIRTIYGIVTGTPLKKVFTLPLNYGAVIHCRGDVFSHIS